MTDIDEPGLDGPESSEDLEYRSSRGRRRRLIAAILLAMFVGLPALAWALVEILSDA